MGNRFSEFSRKDIAYLRSLPAVNDVVDNRINYSEAFKRQCMRRYASGESPVQIFREAGLDSNLIGYKRIERCIARWRRTVMPRVMSPAQGADADGDADGTDMIMAITTGMGMPGEMPGDMRARHLIILNQQIRRIDELELEILSLRRQLIQQRETSQQDQQEPATVS